MEEQLPKLTIKEMRDETFKIFNLEKGLPFTFLNLLKKPLETVQTYLNQHRRRFYNPLQYVLISVAVYTLVIGISPSFKAVMGDIYEKNVKNYAPIEKQLNMPILEPITKAQEFYFAYQNIFYLVILPITSLITFLFFKKTYNYAEHLAINAFVFGTSTWVSILFALLTMFTDHYSVSVIFLPILSLVVMVYMFKYIFKTNWGKALISMLTVYVAIMAIAMFFQIGLAVIFML